MSRNIKNKTETEREREISASGTAMDVFIDCPVLVWFLGLVSISMVGRSGVGVRLMRQ